MTMLAIYAFLGVSVNAFLSGWGWYWQTRKTRIHYEANKYFWDVYLGWPSILMGMFLGFLGGVLLWQSWWLPLLTSILGFLVTLLAIFIGALIAPDRNKPPRS